MSQTKTLVDAIAASNPLQGAFLDAAVVRLEADDLRELDRYIRFWESCGHDIDNLAASYNLFVKDTLREQMYFKRHGCYRYSRFDEVAASVYFADEYMTPYMLGLGISQYLWPNHLQIKHFFERTLPRGADGTYLEVGPGHGGFFMSAVRLGSYSRYVGVDISPKSIEITRTVLDSGVFGSAHDCELRVGDFLTASVDERVNALVMGEVLEHVEEPEALLRKVAEVTTDDAYIFVTTCINSPFVDHIYLYRDVGQVTAQFRDAGFNVESELILPHHGCNLEQCREDKLPINVAYVLGK